MQREAQSLNGSHYHGQRQSDRDEAEFEESYTDLL